MPIIDFFKNEKIIAVIGLAKNTGKTVTLNKILREIHAAERSFGVTSIGRDGEPFDAINEAAQLLRKGGLLEPADPSLL